MDNERLIYNTLKPYFYKTGGDACPLLRHTGRSNECDFVVNIKEMPNDVANNLGYFLGFRIIEMYVKNHGKDSWKDIYNMPLRQFLKKVVTTNTSHQKLNRPTNYPLRSSGNLPVIFHAHQGFQGDCYAPDSLINGNSRFQVF